VTIRGMHGFPSALRYAALALSLSMTALACKADRAERAANGAGESPRAARAVDAPSRFDLGTPATPALLAAIDIDANAAGIGLPAGRGTYEEGAGVYAARCASCHGANGEGVPPSPRLVSTDADTTFRFGNDVKLVKTPGNYWPYATTLYDYIHRAMPFDTPGSLQPNEVYAVVAYLLAENRVIPRTAVMNAQTLPAVRMPARDHFVRDDRTGGRGFR
jgi:S-disulfanyl-L-cysteine oxidoreductase SoxD